MEGRHGRQDSPAQAGHQAIPQVSCGTTAKGQRQDLLGSHRFVGIVQSGQHGLDDGGGLAGTRASEHQQRAMAVVDHLLLIGVERDGLDGRQWRAIKLPGPTRSGLPGHAAHEALVPPEADARPPAAFTGRWSRI